MIVFGSIVSGQDAVKGLMFVKEPLWDNYGMLFDMSEKPKINSMWMKNTYIPLDMLFVDKDGLILDLFQNVPPHSLKSVGSVRATAAVLEVPAGTIEEHNISDACTLYLNE